MSVPHGFNPTESVLPQPGGSVPIHVMQGGNANSTYTRKDLSLLVQYGLVNVPMSAIDNDAKEFLKQIKNPKCSSDTGTGIILDADCWAVSKYIRKIANEAKGLNDASSNMVTAKPIAENKPKNNSTQKNNKNKKPNAVNAPKPNALNAPKPNAVNAPKPNAVNAPKPNAPKPNAPKPNAVNAPKNNKPIAVNKPNTANSATETREVIEELEELKKPETREVIEELEELKKAEELKKSAPEAKKATNQQGGNKTKKTYTIADEELKLGKERMRAMKSILGRNPFSGTRKLLSKNRQQNDYTADKYAITKVNMPTPNIQSSSAITYSAPSKQTIRKNNQLKTGIIPSSNQEKLQQRLEWIIKTNPKRQNWND